MPQVASASERAPFARGSLAGAPIITRARLACDLEGCLPGAGQRIGLLGGSFNPAHAGHRQITLEALKRLRLDRVWWLVSPQNRLKPVAGMAPLAERLEGARKVASHPRIVVTAVERTLGTSATIDTLTSLTHYFHGVKFLWLMGADNLIQIVDWVRWPQIFHTINIAVFDRPTYSQRALVAKAARRYMRYRLSDRRIAGLADSPPPAWAFVRIRLSPLSATALRARGCP